jgi:hypothetical protein
MKIITLTQIETIQGGAFSWSDFFNGACQAETVVGVFANPALMGRVILGAGGISCLFA